MPPCPCELINLKLRVSFSLKDSESAFCKLLTENATYIHSFIFCFMTSNSDNRVIVKFSSHSTKCSQEICFLILVLELIISRKPGKHFNLLDVSLSAKIYKTKGLIICAQESYLVLNFKISWFFQETVFIDSKVSHVFFRAAVPECHQNAAEVWAPQQWQWAIEYQQHSLLGSVTQISKEKLSNSTSSLNQ